MAKQTEPAPAKHNRRREKDPFYSEVQQSDMNAPAGGIGRARRILVADDNPVVLKAFETRLQSDGFKVVSTVDPAAVAKLAGETRAELLILDMHFPPQGAMEWNGFTVIQWLRRFPELSRIPLIIVSGVERASMRDECLAAGARAFFVKPVRYPELLAAILHAFQPDSHATNGPQNPSEPPIQQLRLKDPAKVAS